MVKRKSAKNDKKAYRGKSRRVCECPPKLKTLLERMNWLEPTRTLWFFNEALALIKSEKPDLGDYETLQEAFKLCLDGLPIELQNYVNYGVSILPKEKSELLPFFTGDIFTDTNNRIFRYEEFRLSRLKLSRLAYIYENFNQQNSGASYAVRAINEDFGGAGILKVDEKGIVNLVSDSFGEAISGMILDRIRRCAICKRVFWAVNINSKACSSAHAANLRNQKSRMRNKEKRDQNKELENKKRRENYAYNKKLKKGKEQQSTMVDSCQL